MRATQWRLIRAAFSTLVGLAMAASASGSVILAENFDDGGGVNSIFNFTNTNGQQGAVMGGGPTGNFARLTNLSQSNINSLAFDLAPGMLGPEFTISFDFRMTDDATNAAAGGCCGEAADGLGIGLFDTSVFSATGPLNPLNIWENPTLGAPAGSVMMGLDIFNFGGFGGNNVRMTGLAGAPELLADVTAPFTLNSNVFHRAQWGFTDVGTDAVMSLGLVEDVNGAAVVHNLLGSVLVPGLDLDTFSGRLILGGRTGGAFTNGDVDNILITPEPGTIVLLAAGLAGLALRGRSPRPSTAEPV